MILLAALDLDPQVEHMPWPTDAIQTCVQLDSRHTDRPTPHLGLFSKRPDLLLNLLKTYRKKD